MPPAGKPYAGATDPPNPPVAEPPVALPPIDEPPVDEPPVAVPPIDEPPVEEPPVAVPPIEEPPLAVPPVDEPPVAFEPDAPPLLSSFDSLSPPHATNVVAASVAPNVKSAARPRRDVGSSGGGVLASASLRAQNGQDASSFRTWRLHPGHGTK
jgi:hypothetical protein